MNEMIFVYILSIIGAIAISLSAIKSWFEIKLTAKNKHLVANLARRVSRLENAFKNIEIETEGIDLSGLDISSLLDQLGLDESILKNPIIRGLISRLGKNIDLSKLGKSNEPDIKFEE